MQLREMLLFFAIFLPIVVAGADTRFTNIKCVTLDPGFATFEECRLRMVARGVVALNIYAKLYQLPLTNIWVNLDLYKKANGYRPFLYNQSVDFCRFFKNQKKYPLLKIFSDFVTKDSNLNHSCPYGHDIIVHNLVLNEDVYRFLPLPSGEYMLKVLMKDNNAWKIDIQIYVRRNE